VGSNGLTTNDLSKHAFRFAFLIEVVIPLLSLPFFIVLARKNKLSNQELAVDCDILG